MFRATFQDGGTSIAKIHIATANTDGTKGMFMKVFRYAKAASMALVVSALIWSTQPAFSQGGTEQKKFEAGQDSDRQEGIQERIETRLPEGFRNVFVVVGGQRIHFVIGGSGKPLLLLHGFPTTWYEWAGVMPQLAEDYTVIAADLPGSGDSDAPACCYDKKTMAHELYFAVRRLGYSKVSIVSHDIGGMVAYAYAAQHPEAVERLAIMDVPIPSPIFYTFPALTPNGPGSAWHFGFFNVEKLPEELITGKERPLINYFVLHQAAVPDLFPRKDLAVYTYYFSFRANKHAGFEYYRAFNQDIHDNEQLGKVKLPMPVLAVGGDHSAGPNEFDFVHPFADDVTPLIIPDCGHWIPEEQPDALVRAIRSFFPR